MKYSTGVLCVAAAILSVTSVPVKRDVDPNLVPQFGVTAGVNPDGTGNCDGIPGANGQPIKIPCSCPPDRNTFIADLNANVNAGFAVNNPSVAVQFPTDSSPQSASTRIEAAIITLQNFNGPGVGCPAASTTFVAQQQAAAAGQPAPAAPAPAAPAPAPPAPSPAPPASGGVDPSLVPEFGVTAGVDPTGTGDCAGVNGPNGQPIAIPCSCPPDRNSFINELSQNVAAGFVINNPTVKLSFPTDNSKASQLARLNAATVTLQSLTGPGVGCPQASTTFGAQQAAIEAEPDN